MLAGALAGAAWAAIAGVLKATTGAHEVITTIMLNFIAGLLLAYVLTTEAFLPPGRRTRSRSRSWRACARRASWTASGWTSAS
ncbi:MAG: hypothetical protein R2716_03480 [Microthrixaceae bacterium]